MKTLFRTVSFAASAVMLILAAGCVIYSLTAYCTPEAVISVPPEMIGCWKWDNAELQVFPNGNADYRARTKTGKIITSKLKCVFFRLSVNGAPKTFADVSLAEFPPDWNDGSLLPMLLVPTHNLYAFECRENSLDIRWPDGGALEKRTETSQRFRLDKHLSLWSIPPAEWEKRIAEEYHRIFPVETQPARFLRVTEPPRSSGK